MTTVVHKNKAPFDIYIGRPSKWGNPFVRKGISITQEQRRQAIVLYRFWIQHQPHLMAALPELRGKVLGCWCKPQACHGDVLAELADSGVAQPDRAPDSTGRSPV